MPAKRIVYLFGAGATIAEMAFAGIARGLTLRAVSEMVIKEAMRDPELSKVLGNIASDDIRDIERYISLLESFRVKKYTDIANIFRKLFCQCIQENLTQNGEFIKPLLTMALLQMHRVEKIKESEELKGVITINYDNILDRAFNEIYGGVNYGITCKCVSGGYNIDEDWPQLIKLHGSFNWRRGFPLTLIDENQAQSGEQEEMIWIPPGIEKERERYPFNILWGEAFEMLDCDILRIVGCSLSQNDWGLTSLLFNSQLRTGPEERYEIEIVNKHQNGVKIRNENGFLRNVMVLGELDNCQDLVDAKPSNAFESWLRRRISYFIDRGIQIHDMGLQYIDLLIGGEEK